jgi:ubiquitin-protein ligase
MNRGNPAVKRILADVKELQQHPSSRYYAEPTEDNMFGKHSTMFNRHDAMDFILYMYRFYR